MTHACCMYDKRFALVLNSFRNFFHGHRFFTPEKVWIPFARLPIRAIAVKYLTLVFFLEFQMLF